MTHLDVHSLPGRMFQAATKGEQRPRYADQDGSDTGRSLIATLSSRGTVPGYDTQKLHKS